jgi:hypothetical protein
VTQLAAVPGNLAGCGNRRSLQDAAAALAPTGRLVTAAFVIVFAFVLVRRMLRTTVALVKRHG